MVHSCYHFCEAGDSLLATGGVDGSVKQVVHC